jgi:hypothetical protein
MQLYQLVEGPISTISHISGDIKRLSPLKIYWLSQYAFYAVKVLANECTCTVLSYANPT